jgi:hypothetical protein
VSAGCPHCGNAFSGCVCAPCASCGGLTFTDEFQFVHVCSSGWGELTTAIRSTDMMLVQDGSYQSCGQAGIYPDEPRGVRTAQLLTPSRKPEPRQSFGTLPTRVLP